MTLHPEFAWAATPESVDPKLLRAIYEIKQTTDDDVSVVQGSGYRQFGHTISLDNSTEAFIWDGLAINGEAPNFPSNAGGNNIDSIISTSAADTQDVLVVGHTLSGGNLTRVFQTVTLTGQTRAALATPLYTCTDAYNAGSTNFAGAISIYDDANGQSAGGVPNDPTDVANYLPIGDSESQTAVGATAFDEYLLLTKLRFGVDRQTTAVVDFKLQIRTLTGVWLPASTEVPVGSSSSAYQELTMDPVIIIPPNSLIAASGISSVSQDTQCSAAFSGYMAKVV